MITDEKLKKIKGELTYWTTNSDTEIAHGAADTLICELLIELGYKDVVEIWNEVPKWYA